MKTTRVTWAFAAGAVLSAVGSPALAQSPWSVNGTAGIVSDYRYRGYSLSGGGAAVQAGMRVSHSTGFYADGYLSSIEEYGVNEDGDGANLELTGSLGWMGAVRGLEVEAAVSAYRYPDGGDVNYFEIPVQVRRTVGAVSWTLGGAYAPSQSALSSEDNRYGWAAFEYAPSTWPFSLSSRVGYEKGAFASDGKVDWAASAQHDVGPVTLALSWVDSDVERGALVASAFVSF